MQLHSVYKIFMSGVSTAAGSLLRASSVEAIHLKMMTIRIRLIKTRKNKKGLQAIYGRRSAYTTRLTNDSHFTFSVIGDEMRRLAY